MGQTLHSLTTTAGANVTLNVNPLTDLILIKALQARGSTYPQVVTNFIGGESFPTVLITTPAGDATCRSLKYAKASRSDLTPFVGTYRLKIGISITTIPLTIASILL
ncbi:MAG: hypothetical protein H7Z73_03275 [Candidatus Saccharibacteria bacterium]|nr:hypothetical protein [Moraxellaceae bacterium]